MRDAEENSSSDCEDNCLPNTPAIGLEYSSFVVAVYKGQPFLAEVTFDHDSVDGNYTKLSYMQIKGNYVFGWGAKDKVVTLKFTDIPLKNAEVIPANNRGHLTLNAKDIKFVMNWMLSFTRIHIFSLIKKIVSN